MSNSNKNNHWIKTLISSHVATSPENNLALPGNEKIFDQPLLGFSSGAAPLYDEFKNHIGNFYFTPLELFRQTFPEKETEKKDLTVISWPLPSTEDIKRITVSVFQRSSTP